MFRSVIGHANRSIKTIHFANVKRYKPCRRLLLSRLEQTTGREKNGRPFHSSVFAMADDKDYVDVTSESFASEVIEPSKEGTAVVLDWWVTRIDNHDRC